MAASERILSQIYAAVDEVNLLLPERQQLEKSRDAVLFGRAGALDSLGLVSLIVAVEHRIGDEFRVAISLADEKALSQERSPFRTIGTLGDYISSLLEGKSDRG